MKLTVIFFAIIIFIFSPEIKAQDEIEVAISDTTSECDIYLQSRKLIKDAAIIGVKDSSLYILKRDITKELNIADVRTIKFKARNGFWTGAAIGAGANALFFLTMAIVVPPSKGEFAGFNKIIFLAFSVAGIVPAGLIGGFIGAMSDEDNVYNLPKGDVKNKIRIIRKIIKDNR